MLTERTIAAAVQDARRSRKVCWLHESRGRGQGALSLKIAASGTAAWYYRYSVERKNKYFPLGAYGDQSDRLTLADARVQCSNAAAKRQNAIDGDLHASEREKLAAEHRRKENESRAATDAAAEALARTKFTLKALMDAYISHLKGAGKPSAGDVRRMVTLHVYEAFPKYALSPAKDLTREQATEIFRRLVEVGKGRTAGKVRTSLHAAFELALGIDGDAAAPSTMTGFSIAFNPIAATKALNQFNRVGQRHLSTTEFRAFWSHLSQTEGLATAAVRVAVLAGAQRIAQLLRVKRPDYDCDAKILTLFDHKGRRQSPRRHDIPLPAGAIAIVEQCLSLIQNGAEDQRIFGTTVPDTVSDVISKISAAMIASGEAVAGFGWTDIRRTVETLLIEEFHVSKDLRSQILSHGLGGVQNRHYDRADYTRQIRPILARWDAWVIGKKCIGSNTVFQIQPERRKQQNRRRTWLLPKHAAL
ncbi:TPA: integrase arm-type DNA-binding domain-containing protein [Burkholderia aenigmatica]|uniref:tyrosine-type recombinase/integrase n=1 Tax=Burkholderia sp. AU45251 TaxID=3059204 RepID=UPI0026544096|nr:integrase family protein [Burkholderia sp. AU45251]HDR9486724.1 integrase arm-type DNA-binding domain-containing protein [Burkholderia aenigmatica]MDN7518485.1 integrase family protein [Burkholderia sp. AU45251]HDR9518277.1 integrase arm-type DNA-binding domain-containing protein [Burkholderia aenigmatica]HDR9595144.1 integrase arm-type DNA-binding domain-containing protein [Burkholderia aenigmatica]HDR9604400.1 integrase arm-type DNA-binding domain-containing protein [Burkholderia aenigmat